MNTQTWIDWCQKQLGDLSRRLLRQGYHPTRIEYLSRTFPEFKSRFYNFSSRLQNIMDKMAENPEGYHHYECFTEAKMELLRFTNLHRELYLDMNIAETA